MKKDSTNLIRDVINCIHSNNYKSPPKVVVSRGSPHSKLMIIGEAPGAKEDEIGKPFVGRSGQLLDKLLKNAGINPETEVFICNAVKCRPPGNRRPSKDELKSALPWLYQQIQLIDPWIIILAGSTAVETLTGKKGRMSTIRGIWQDWEGRIVMPLFHPSYLLRNPSKSDGSPASLTRSDLLKVRLRLNDFQSSMTIPTLSVDGGMAQ